MNDISNEELQRRVTEMYMSTPIPNYDDDKILNVIKELKRNYYVTLGFDPDEFFPGKRVLDGGCGTGEESLVIGSFGAKEVVGIDLSDASLKRAKEKKEYLKIDNVNFYKQSVLDIEFEDNTFDVVFSAGVIHHTPDPYKGFQELVRVLKPGGVLMLFVYNDCGHFFHNVEKKIVEILGGEDIHKRYIWAKRLYPWRMNRNKGDSPHSHFDMEALLYDQYAVPKKSEHSIKEVLSWFEKNNIDYVSSVPPIEMKKLVQYVHRRGIDAENSGANKGILKRLLFSLARSVSEYPEINNQLHSSSNPAFSSIILSNIMYIARSFIDYSSGPRYMGIKRK